MIPLKCAELLFLIGCISLVCRSKSNFVNFSSSNKNNKHFFMNQLDDIIGSGVLVDDHYLFTTKSLPNDSKLWPTLSNGHIGFTIFSNSVYMNGLYNGKGGLSHRARIPNFANIQFDDDCRGAAAKCKYTLNLKHGFFMVEMNVENEFIATHLIYAHRFYNRAIINQFHIQRLSSKDDIKIKICEKNFTSTGCRERNNETCPAHDDDVVKDDLEFTKNETIHFNECDFQLLCGHIMEMEVKEASQEEATMRQKEDVCVLWNHVPEEITLSKTASSISYKFVMAVDTIVADVRQEMIDVFSITNEELLISHINQWNNFWSNFHISIDGDDELLRAIISSAFNIACNLPSQHTNLPQYPFYGLSPTGLGRGDGCDLNDYEGHNFWDTEIFMFPSIALINQWWAEQLLHYRYMMLNSARDYAKTTNYSGARYPWESAASGYEVIQPGYEYIAEYQHHITGDISNAMELYFGATRNLKWAKEEGCEMAEEIAKFWQSRVSFNESTGFYDINNIMGPDEDHEDTRNNVYTNVIAAKALRFGSFMRSLCDGDTSHDKWIEIAEKIRIIYDESLDYHPEFEGYVKGEEVKQADTILIGYPLMFPMNESTRRNDLNYYVDATRKSGPAMTYSIFCINYLDIGDVEDANEMLVRSYKPYIRKPFNVWSEVVEGDEGAGNFITGAGGFLQAIFNGFLGIRIHREFLEIKNPQLPKNSKKVKIGGFSFLNSKFEINLKKNVKKLKFIELGDKLMLKRDNEDEIEIIQGLSYDITECLSVKIW